MKSLGSLLFPSKGRIICFTVHMAEIIDAPCMRCTQMNEIAAARRHGDKERNTGRQRETEQTITTTVFYRLTPRRRWSTVPWTVKKSPQ